MSSRRTFLKLTGSAIATGAILGSSSTALAAEKPNMRWEPAHYSNYSNESRGVSDMRWIVLHTIEGDADAGISWFQNPDADVSSHFVVDADGGITKMVNLEDVAWTNGNGPYNDTAINIEMAGYAGETDFSEAMYESVAQLCAYLCETYDIPKRHPTYDIAPCSAYDGQGGLIGHEQIPSPYDCSDVTGGKVDPGPTWNWDYLLQKMDGESGGGSPGFEIGQDVESTAAINVRSSAEIADNVKHTQPSGTGGTVKNGYVTADGYTWWWINWENGVGGWSVQEYLQTVSDGGDGGDDGGNDGGNAKFEIGQEVRTTTRLNVRAEGTTDAPVEMTVDEGAMGFVKNGYVTNDGYTWWEIEYDQVRGWCAQEFLTGTSGDGGGSGPIQGMPYFYQYNNDIDPSGTCGNTSVTMLLNYYGWDGTPDDVSYTYGDAQSTRPPGAAEAFNEIAADAGLDQRVTDDYQWSISKLRETVRSGTPVIVWGMFTPPGHIMPVVGYENGEYICHDPAGIWNGKYEGGHYGDSNDGEYVRYDAETYEAAIDYSSNALEVVVPR